MLDHRCHSRPFWRSVLSGERSFAATHRNDGVLPVAAIVSLRTAVVRREPRASPPSSARMSEERLARDPPTAVRLRGDSRSTIGPTNPAESGHPNEPTLNSEVRPLARRLASGLELNGL
jgi:hypothetical protein